MTATKAAPVIDRRALGALPSTFHHGKKPKEGSYVWVKDSSIAGSALYTKGHILAISGNKVTVETSNDVKTQELVLPLGECFQICPDADVPDHCQLMHLSQPTLLENTRKRYEEDKIYTYVGDILVAVNPFKVISGLYGTAVMSQCRGRKLHNTECGPHAYAIAEKAYVTMKKSGHNQSIVVSGESGAGKTETNKQLMNYLVWRGSDEQSMHDLTRKILDTNPILESFGNAKTTRNNNSSRFGRYVLLQFSDIGEVVGAEIRTFLLERSRVTSTTSANERAYHVMYQVAKGSPHSLLPVEQYRYLSMSGCSTIGGIDDKLYFKETSEALQVLGCSGGFIDDLWAYIAAMLYLGNVDFGDLHDEHAKAAIHNRDMLNKSEELLGVSHLEELLVKRIIDTGGERVHIEHTPAQAGLARDSLAKVMYDRLFNYLVSRINANVNNKSKAALFLGLLDVYGFEFFQVNSFEQLCINFANEKLQQYFLEVVFMREEEMYKAEGVPWNPVPYVDNNEVCRLLEAPPHGIYVILDSQMRAGNATGKTFCAELHQHHAKSTVFDAPKTSRSDPRTKEDYFLVRHFAGDVVYLANEFLAKNNDSLPPGFDDELSKSSKEIVRDVTTQQQPVEQPVGGQNKSKSSFGSVGAKFIKSLKGLMAELNSSKAHFIRCIKPSMSMRPRDFHGEAVMTQLRLSGTLEAVRLIQTGHPTRIPYETIASRYRHMMPPQIQALPPPQFCEVIAAVCGVGKSEYCLGVSRIFFKLGAAAILEDLADAEPEEMRPILLAKLALFEKQKEAKPVIEKNLQMWLAKRRYEATLAAKRKREEEERRKEEERKRKEEERRRKEQEAKRRAEEAEKRRLEEEEGRKRAALEAERRAAEESRMAEYRREQQQRVDEEAKANAVLGHIEQLVQEVEDDKDLEDAVVMAGGVKALIKMARKFVDSSSVQARFAGVLRDLCISDEIALEISNAGGVEGIIEAARRHYDSPEVQIAVSGALRNLSELDEIALEIARLGGVEALVDAAARHKDDQDVQSRVAGAIWALSVHDAVTSKIVDSGGIDALIASAKHLLMNAEVQAAAAGAVRNLSVNDQLKQSIADVDGVRVLIAASENHLGNEQVQAQVAGSFRNLSLNDEVAAHIASSGGIEALVGAARAHAGHAKVQAAVAGALRNLSVDDEIAEDIARLGGIEVLVASSRDHPLNSDVQAEVTGALWGLAVNDEVEQAISQADGVQVLVKAAQSHLRSAKVQARVAGALRKLSASDHNKQEIASHSGIETLIESSRIHAENAVVQAGVAGALSNLSVDDDIEQEIASRGGIEVLIAASNAHADNVKVQSRVVRALTNMSVHDKNKGRIVECNGIAALIRASQEHLNSAEVQAGVAGALRNLSVSSEISSMIVKQQAIAVLLQAVRLHAANAVVQAGVIGALRNLSVTPAHRELIVEAGGVDVLLAAKEMHSANLKLTKDADGALRNLRASLHLPIDGATISEDSAGGADPPPSHRSSMRMLLTGRQSPRNGGGLGTARATSPSARSKSPRPPSPRRLSRAPAKTFGGLTRRLSRTQSPRRPA